MVAVLLLLLLIVACVLMLVVRDRPRCNVKFLTLNEVQMSGRWQISDRDLWPAFLPIQDRLGAQEAFRMVMKSDDGGTIGHTVYRYHNSLLAVFHFWFDRAVFFPSACTDWSDFQEANDLPLHADQQQIKRGIATCSPLADYCSAVLRYGPYISDFDSSVGEQGDMSMEEFLRVVLMIDERFKSCGY
jgi:hypothetical protein